MRNPDAVARLLDAPPDLPVVAALPQLRALLLGYDAQPETADDVLRGAATVVTAPPGTGKTTLVPPLVADVLRERAELDATSADCASPYPDKVIVTQPRRIAARAAARRLASLLGEPVGQTVGYAVHGERRAGSGTRIEVVTAGLLLRRLQADPTLEGVGAVVLDEVHERSLDSDLLLALLLDARAALREDLTLVAMSATLDAERLRTLLGDGDAPAPLVEVCARTHPVTEHWCPPPDATPRLGPRGVPREFLTHVTATVLRALDEPVPKVPGQVADGSAGSADVLVFLPGAREVDAVVTSLREALPGLAGDAKVDVLPLHGRLPSKQQDAALAPSAPGRRRVVVATNVAESSLTVPGVRVVVDSTLAREPRLDVARGISGLVTVGVSRAAGTQRAGRAGREGPGAVLRCCSQVDWARAALAPMPEILSADLTRAALELASWGTPSGEGLTWLDAPPTAAFTAAREVLRGLGLCDDDGTVTPLGRAVVAVPTEVREARALLAAAPVLGARRAAEATALLASDLRAPGGDLTALARQVRSGGSRSRGAGTGPTSGTWQAEAARLEQAVRAAGDVVGELAAEASSRTPGATGAAETPGTLADAVALVAGLVHPEWVARRRGEAPRAGAEAHYLTVAGVGVRLPAGAPLAGSRWLAVAELDRTPGGTGRGADALVRAAAPLEEAEALRLAVPWLVEQERTVWDEGRLRAERVRRLGAITLGSVPGGVPEPKAVSVAVVAACEAEAAAGRAALGLLPWDQEAATLRARLALLHRVLGEPWPAVDDAALLARASEWLAPAVEAMARTGGGRRFDLGRLDVVGALRALLPWSAVSRLAELVPERLEVPSGSAVRLDYVGEQGEMLERPVLAVRVQECFGWAATPSVVEGRVPVLLHLLSPARRPVAVTDDLRSFWEGPYRQVRAELRGRYPKHSWPEDPWTAPALRGTKKRG
ncbi:ATP-dependent helicase HrpB [Actinomyces trachealis]|uniref:ATP-dependent helicase HrpB n=1 Tax=Actinomyces trachealis TaxID=2763540 RepID=UPI0018929E0C|nr:ATP-dependent helicase HrpB [Actinomyces trachealis]